MTIQLTAVGVGPGDPELITLKGIRAIEAADVVFVPANRDGDESLALSVAEPWVDTSRQKVVQLVLAMTKKSDEAQQYYQAAAAQIASTMTAYAVDHQEVRGVYLLLGDPLLYGSFAPIRRELATFVPHMDIAVVPGITSFAAAAAKTHAVLGAGDDRVAIVPATPALDATMLQHLLAENETLILLKVGRMLPQILDALDDIGMLDSTLFIERLGLEGEEIIWDVQTLRGQSRSYLSLLIVRKEPFANVFSQ